MSVKKGIYEMWVWRKWKDNSECGENDCQNKIMKILLTKRMQFENWEIDIQEKYHKTLFTITRSWEVEMTKAEATFYIRANLQVNKVLQFVGEFLFYLKKMNWGQLSYLHRLSYASPTWTPKGYSNRGVGWLKSVKKPEVAGRAIKVCE